MLILKPVHPTRMITVEPAPARAASESEAQPAPQAASLRPEPGPPRRVGQSHFVTPSHGPLSAASDSVRVTVTVAAGESASQKSSESAEFQVEDSSGLGFQVLSVWPTCPCQPGCIPLVRRHARLGLGPPAGSPSRRPRHRGSRELPDVGAGHDTRTAGTPAFINIKLNAGHGDSP